MENKYKSKAVYCGFREKNRQGKFNAMKVVFENKRQYVSPSTSVDWFYTAYYRNLIIRPECFNCKYASTERCSDITLGDYWNSYEAVNWGESLIMCNTEYGKEMADVLCERMEIKRIAFDEKKQPQLCGATKKPADYEYFYKIYKEKGYLEAQKYIGNNTVKGKLKHLTVSVFCELGLAVLLKKIKSKVKRND